MDPQRYGTQIQPKQLKQERLHPRNIHKSTPAAALPYHHWSFVYFRLKARLANHCHLRLFPAFWAALLDPKFEKGLKV
jgi:hypothetical protein